MRDSNPDLIFVIVKIIKKPRTLSTRNARMTLAVSFMSDLVFILPIWILFGTNELGLSVTLTTALFMTIWLGSAALELPTGALADRLGRKRMFLIGAALMAGYPLVYALEAPVPIIFAVSVLAALGSALRSGTLIPLTHDAYKKEGRSEHEYHAFLSTEKTLSYIARALSGVVGGLLYTANPHAPYIAMFVVYIAIFMAGLFVVDAAARSELSQTKHMGRAFRTMAHSPPIVMIIGCYICAGLVAEAIWTAFQPFFEQDGLNAGTIGVVFSALALISALGAYCVRFVLRRIGILRIQLLMVLLIAVTASLLVTPVKELHIAAVVPIAFAFGMQMTPLIATVQKYIAEKFHSTALSVVGLLQYGVYGLASLYVGALIDWLGVANTRQVLCAEALFIAVLLAVYYALHKRADVIVSAKDNGALDEVGAPAA
jgi:MFS family permease